ncbi:nineteen complex-related protein 2-domain-containing protein [Stachybotrys elegans]|uniref:Nineteen complex-related protein 2-domain-containing protein n=1 Tax=Stachybotrys elegans TaxID=80388 RepID=A0A8K0SYQ8_9HYPO|nr:nineteen complex-related protein 2-domain-containing protein [Stachybotrys elegans]
MSSFGAKRKARVIKVDDDDSGHDNPAPAADEGSSSEDVSRPIFSSKSSKKSFRQSGLRRTLNANDGDETANGNEAPKDEEDDGPVVVRPSAGRASSMKKKRPPKTSRLSFGGDADTAALDTDEPIALKKVPLGQQVLENSALKKGLSNRGLPLRSSRDDEDRPKYSKEYLEELQSSTPNTPHNASSLASEMGDEMELDPSELEGALVVETHEAPPVPSHRTEILTDAEIRERKERRARLAKEENFLSVEDDDEDDDDRLGQKKKKDNTRLVAEDEDIGEGFDNFVEDGGLSLGKRAEKERRKRERQQMAEMINAAEGHSSDSSDDSDAERRIAYESAQTRAGMDGMKKLRKDPAQELLQVPPKITPLPSLAECLSKLQATIKSMQVDIQAKSFKVEQLKLERGEIDKREAEVQALLDETGKKYQEAMGQGKTESVVISENTASLDLIGERGLESLGATPKASAGEADT